jgi:hypothetical protein
MHPLRDQHSYEADHIQFDSLHCPVADGEVRNKYASRFA